MKRIKIDSPSCFIGREGEGLISFGSGQPDLPPPDESYKILPAYKDFKYGPVQGSERLRDAIASQYNGAEGADFVITNGASEALDLVCRILSKKGKSVLVPRPYYYSYPYTIKYAGMECIYYDLVNGKIDSEQITDLITNSGAAAIIINSPSNPTGTIQEVDVLQKIEALTKSVGMYIISDEVYKDLIYERENYHFDSGHVITINSFSKTFAMCGFRIGYLYSNDKDLIKEVVEMKTHTSMNTNILGQEMAYQATQAPESYIGEQVAVWKARRDVIYQGLVDLGLSLWKPEGAFYVFPAFNDSTKVVNDLYYDHNMITYDGKWFGAPGRVRFSYALEIDKIDDGLGRLQTYLRNNPNEMAA